MPAVQERINALVNDHARSAEQFGQLRRELVELESQVMRGLMLKLADEDETIVSFRFSAEYAYDDEGSYFWTSTINATKEDDSEEWLEDVESWSSEENTQVAFEAETQWDGEITVARLRELWAE